MKSYILLTEKKWHKNLFEQLKSDYKYRANWTLINNLKDFNIFNLNKLKPNIIFIPHWSYIIPKEIFTEFDCIVFHMSDLPFGRGGSPLQNLIIRGIKSTKISAIKVDEGLDTGDIFLKMPLKLKGTAREIFENASSFIYLMIRKIIDENIEPYPQVGEPVIFKRRKSEESNIVSLEELKQVYDYIRMLDCDGYPSAFVETNHFRFEFSNAILDKKKNLINANVKIYRK